MITLTQTNSWYHTSGGTSRTAWIEGGARKSTTAGQTDIGLIRFDAGGISEACANGAPPAARLILERETGTGDGDVDITIAPARYLSNVIDSMTLEECLQLAMRDLHHTVTVSGASCQVRLPGAWLDLLTRGRVNAFLIYREGEEGTDAAARFKENAQLAIESTGSFHIYISPPV